MLILNFLSFIQINVHYTHRNVKNYQEHKTKLSFERMILPVAVHATNCIFVVFT